MSTFGLSSETGTMLVNNSQTRRRTLLKHSLLFNKAKHSEEWHQSVDAVAGVLHPSDPKFPYLLLRQATDAYLKKKGKITQVNADIRLSILIDTHNARDIAVAAVAHAITASSLRAALHVDLNVAHGSYWGLEAWLQCLIAANHGNPASVTDLEAQWARHLLPFATHGSGAAAKVLVGISQRLRECATPNMNTVPEFLALTKRALTDYAAQLEGLRLKNNWVAARVASAWMVELGRTSSVMAPPGNLFPGHILDAQFPIWRVWACWTPDLMRIMRLSSMDSNSAAVLADLLALEGPDFVNGTKRTLKDGLVERYNPERGWVKYGGLVIEVPSRTKDGLRDLLESAASTLDTACLAASAVRPGALKIFSKLTVAQPMTQEALNLVQAVLFMGDNIGAEAIDAISCVYTEGGDLGGGHIMELQNLIQTLDHDRASGLRRILLTPTTLRGISQCIQDCQSAISTLLQQHQPWTELAQEFHTFCSVLKKSKNVPVIGEKIIGQMCLLLPSPEHMAMAIEIYTAAHCQRLDNSSEPSKKDEITNTPRITERNGQRVAAPEFLLGERRVLRHPLEEVVEQYCLHRLLAQQEPSRTTQRMFDTVLRIWEGTSSPGITQDRRSLAIVVSRLAGDNVELGIRCLCGIASTSEQLGPGLLVKAILIILEDMDSHPNRCIVRLIRLLARCSFAQDFKAQLLCWRDLAYHLLTQELRLEVFQDRNLVDYTLRTMKAGEWLTFLTDAKALFATGPASSSEGGDVPLVLHPELQNWKSWLVYYRKTLERLEVALGDESEAMKCILSRKGARSAGLLKMLTWLKLAEGEPVEPFLHKIVSLLSTKANNAWEVEACMHFVAHADPETLEICKKIWDAKHGRLNIPGLPTHDRTSGPQGARDSTLPQTANSSSKTVSKVKEDPSTTPPNSTSSQYDVPASVVEVMVTGWMLDDKAPESTKDTVGSIACLLHIKQDFSDISKDKLLEAGKFWAKIEDDLFQEAKRLEQVQKTLKLKDPKGTVLLLQQIGVPDTTELDEEIAKLPTSVIDAVERVGDNEVEISFSLAAFTQLERAAMGIPEATNTILLRLFLDYSGELSPSFCIHYNNDPGLESLEHSRYSCSSSSELPSKQICKSVPSAFIWQLNRKVHTQLRGHYTGIADLHQSLTKLLPTMFQYCIACGSSHNAGDAYLRRYTPCDLSSCSQLWYGLPLHVRIPEIRTDTFAVDILLSSIYAAAMTGKPELLPSCPIRSSETVKAILNALPTMAVIRDATDPFSVLNLYHPSAEKLISWAVLHHRGFLTTATGLLKIPNLPPGTHQFILANASPKLESVFMSKIPKSNAQTTVLFHGTSLDRLPAILAQGLRICSGTHLQRTGAVHGQGIYLSDDPATSFSYSPASLSWKNSGLSNMRMLLGCEVVGQGNRVSGNIHVIKDVDSVMVRYVLLFTKEAKMPIRGHVEPAMASGMAALRSRVV